MNASAYCVTAPSFLRSEMIMFYYDIVADVVTDFLSMLCLQDFGVNLLIIFLSRFHSCRPTLAHPSVCPSETFYWRCTLP